MASSIFLAADRLGSVIFYGAPSTGKTTLACAARTNYFFRLFRRNALLRARGG